MMLKIRSRVGVFEPAKCACGGNDFSVRGIASLFPEFDSLVGKQFVCSNCGAALLPDIPLVPLYPVPAEKVIVP